LTIYAFGDVEPAIDPMAWVHPQAVVTRGFEVPARALARGVPARVESEAIEPGRWTAGVQRYVEMAARYRRELRVID
jgi:carbonic anhydrase/acetyltransferase-like protein (isoleucine patch superfamily)